MKTFPLRATQTAFAEYNYHREAIHGLRHSDCISRNELPAFASFSSGGRTPGDLSKLVTLENCASPRRSIKYVAQDIFNRKRSTRDGNPLRTLSLRSLKEFHSISREILGDGGWRQCELSRLGRGLSLKQGIWA